MFDYKIHKDYIQASFDGKPKKILFIKNSGRILTLDEDDLNPVEFTHNAIMLGEDEDGQKWIVHNHWTPMKVEVTTLQDYTHNFDYKWIFKNQKCTNSPQQIISKALEEAKKETRYNILTYNCQQFTSLICNSERNSSELTKWATISLIVIVIILLVRG